MNTADPIVAAWCACASWASAAGRVALAYELVLDIELMILGLSLEAVARAGRARAEGYRHDP